MNPSRRPAVARRLPVLALLLLLVVPAQAQLIPSFGRDRAGTSALQFLKIPVDPRSAALGETVAANAFDASALFWNPALAAQTQGTQIGFSHTAYHAGVSMEYAALIYHVGGFALGGSLQALDSGAMDVTTEFEPFGTGQTFRFVDLSGGLTVSQRLTDLFSYGLTFKYIRESVAGLTTHTGVADLGIFYRVGTTGAQMAVAIRNFGLDRSPGGELERTVIGGQGTVVEDDFESLTPPTTFLLGVTYDVLQGPGRNDFMISGQLTNPNDNAESFNIGAEYTWNDLLILRTGYRFGIDEYTTPSLGAGFLLSSLPGGASARFDYGFTRLDWLGAVHRVGLNLSF